MNYEIIKDEEALKSFIEWLPDTKTNETYYVALLARNKYIRDLGIGTFNSDKHQCKRFLSTKERLFEKIKQLECSVGSYVVKNTQVPQEALALYISINPRDQVKATKESLIKFAELVAKGSTCHSPHQEVISQVHKSCGTKHFVDFDFDGLDYKDCKDQVSTYINLDCVSFLETRGGFHLLVSVKDIDKKYEKSWYKNLSNMNGVDIIGDTLIPVPGCTQGQFVPILHSNSNSYKA